MPQEFNPLPACPIPIQWDVDSRIKELQAMIDDPATSEDQKTNLRAAIDLYNKGELPGPSRFIQDGKVVSPKDLDIYRAWWSEGYAQQLSSQAIAPDLSSTPSESPLSQQLAHRVAYNLYPAAVTANGHKMFARIRPVPIPGLPPPPSIDITLLNDTGSDRQTFLDTDLVALGIPANYAGYGPPVLISTANGMVWRRQVLLEIQLLTPQGEVASNWIREPGVVTPAVPGAVRLSGDGIRQELYFATAPGNQQLYVAMKKNGIVTQLPVV